MSNEELQRMIVFLLVIFILIFAFLFLGGMHAMFCPFCGSYSAGYVFFLLAILLLVIFYVLYPVPRSETTEKRPSTKKKETKAKKSEQKLGSEENRVLKLIKDKGEIMQSEIPKLTGLSRLEVSRIIRELERKKLIKREKKGRTYIIKAI